MMSLFILDTDHVTLLRRGHSSVKKRAAMIASAQLATTVISIEEQMSGWYSYLRQAKRDIAKIEKGYSRLHQLVEWIPTIRILPFPHTAVVRSFELRRQYPSRGKMDLSIAAIALEYGAKVVTRNVTDFIGIAGLEIEDWTVDSVAG